MGHATALIQLPGLNLLIDPVWSERSSPWRYLGPRRFVKAIPALETLPGIDAVKASPDAGGTGIASARPCSPRCASTSYSSAT